MTWYSKNSWTIAKKSTGHDGSIYDSKFEAGGGNDLLLRKRAKDIKNYVRQVNFPLTVNGYKVGVYIADFVIEHNDGSKEILEMKGRSTDVFKLKWRLMEAIYGEEYKLTIIYQGKGSMRHAKKVIEF